MTKSEMWFELFKVALGGLCSNQAVPEQLLELDANDPSMALVKMAEEIADKAVLVCYDRKWRETH